MASFKEELSWFARLGCLASGAPSLGGKCAQQKEPTACRAEAEGPSFDDAEWKSFDLADVMEAGEARELTTSYTVALPPEKPASHLVVERSRDRRRHLLQTQGGEPLLLAVCDKEDCSRIDFFVPAGGDPPVALGPAFQLAAQDNELKSWSLTTDRCECCEYLPAGRSSCCSARSRSDTTCRRELLHITHKRQDFGPVSMMTMEVEMPELRPDGSPSLWCRRAGGRQGRQRVLLGSRRPAWNRRTRSLTLDFHGRCSKPSIQNFQLDLPTGEKRSKAALKAKEPELLFGRVDVNRFVLDYKHPLGMAQAFAIALTTNLWQ